MWRRLCLQIRSWLLLKTLNFIWSIWIDLFCFSSPPVLPSALLLSLCLPFPIFFLCLFVFLRYRDIYFDEPSVEEENMETVKVNPNDCRLRDLTYAAPILVNVEYTRGLRVSSSCLFALIPRASSLWVWCFFLPLPSLYLIFHSVVRFLVFFHTGKEIVMRDKLSIGRMPVMLRSSKCVLSRMNQSELARARECPLDPGKSFLLVVSSFCFLFVLFVSWLGLLFVPRFLFPCFPYCFACFLSLHFWFLSPFRLLAFRWLFYCEGSRKGHSFARAAQQKQNYHRTRCEEAAHGFGPKACCQ